MERLTKDRIIINTIILLLFFGFIYLYNTFTTPLFKKENENIICIYKNIKNELKINNSTYNFDPFLIINEKYIKTIDNKSIVKLNFKSIDNYNITLDCIFSYDIDVINAINNYESLNVVSNFYDPLLLENKKLTEEKLSSEMFVESQKFSITKIKDVIVNIIKENISTEEKYIKNLNVIIKNLRITKDV